MDTRVVSLLCLSLLLISTTGNHKVDPEKIAAWNDAVASGNVDKVKELIQEPLDKLKDAADREEKLRVMLEPTDENFKHWMKTGEGVDADAMFDILHGIPAAVYDLDVVTPVYHAYMWLHERLADGGTRADHESRVWLERSEWLLVHKIESLQRMENHLYAIAPLIGHKNEHVSTDRELGRLGIAFYSEIGTLPWKETNELGTPEEAMNKFVEVFENEVKAGTFNPPAEETDVSPEVQSDEDTDRTPQPQPQPLIQSQPLTQSQSMVNFFNLWANSANQLFKSLSNSQ